MILILALSCVLCATGCRKSGDTPQVRDNQAPTDSGRIESRSDPESVEASFEGAKITWADEKGRPVWEAHFKEAVASRADGDAAVELHGVEASLYRDGRIASRLVAPRVDANSRTKEVRAFGGVKLVSAKHDALTQSDKLVWNVSEGKVYGAGKVRMRRGNLSIAAQEFEADTGLDRARFTNGTASVGDQ